MVGNWTRNPGRPTGRWFNSFAFRHLAAAGLLLALGTLAEAKTSARVYAATGLFGVAGGFSWGVYTVTDRARAEIPDVRTYVKPHYRWRELAATAAANYKIDKLPIVLIGHSLGGDATVSIADRLLAAGVPVEAIVAYDPTPRIGCIPANVHKAADFYNSGWGLGGGDIEPCRGFTGVIENNYKWINHVRLDDDPDVHRATLCEIRHAIARASPGICAMPVSWLKGIKRGAAYPSTYPSHLPTERPDDIR